MKNLVKLSDVRKEYANIKGTPCAIVKQVFASIEGEGEKAQFLRSVLPSKQAAIDNISAICAAYNVGGTRKNGTQIRFSADMLIRYYTKSTNAETAKSIAEKKASKRAEEKKQRDAKKAKEQEEKEARKQKREAEKKAREEKAASNLQVEKARTEEKKRQEKKNGKK